MKKFLILPIAFLLTACPKADEAKEAPKEETKAPEEEKTPATAMMILQQFHDALEKDCGKDLPKVKPDELKDLEIPAEDQEKANKLLQDIGTFAQQCASNYESPKPEADGSCDPSCHWCPVKWYWCIENAGACAGGDNESCCKLGACGSKHHCEDVCKSSCGCNVPPLPADGGGDGDE